MFLSIVVPIHNTEKYIQNCLDSCLCQDIGFDDYEIICIDDASSDQSLTILKRYERDYKNVRIVSFSNNLGVSAARNIGIKNARGDYIMFLDADDFIEDNCLSFLKRSVTSSNNQIILCVGRLHFVEKGFLDRHENKDNGDCLGCYKEGYVTGKIIPFSLVSKLSFREDIAYGEDEVFCLELFLLGAIFKQVDKMFYYYRVHNESAMFFNKEKERVRFLSVVNSASYIQTKYGLNVEKNRVFVRDRFKIAFGYISKQRRSERKHLLLLMKKEQLAFPSLTSSRLYSVQRAYFYYCTKKISNRFKQILVRTFPFILLFKRKILGHKE